MITVNKYNDRIKLGVQSVGNIVKNDNVVIEEVKKLHDELVESTNYLVYGYDSVTSADKSNLFKAFSDSQKATMELTSSIYNKELKTLIKMLKEYGIEV